MRAQLLRKQSSLNEELMAESRIREKERIRKKIQKQMSLNESFLCRSLFTKRLQVIREGFTTKLKTSTGSLERVTKNGLVKIMQNIKNTGHYNNYATDNNASLSRNGNNHNIQTNCNKNGPISRKLSSSSNSYDMTCANGIMMSNCSSNNNNNNNNNNGSYGNEEMEKIRRHSRESGSGLFGNILSLC
jgi:hypothetical protein